MSPILTGVIASGISGNLTPPFAAGSYESIMTVNVTSNQQTVQFNSIPQTYKHLEIRAISRDTYTNTYPGTYATFNGVGNGTFNYISGDGGGGTGSIGGQISSYTMNSAGGDTPAGNYVTMIARIPDYTESNKPKMMNLLLANSANTYSSLAASFWSWSSGANTPVTSILFGEGDTNFKLAAGSHWALYGIKG